MNKEELIKLVERLMNGDFQTDEEGSNLMRLLENNVPRS